MQLLIFILSSFLALSKTQVSREKTFEEAGKFLKLGMNQNAKPCEECFEHVCGNLGENDTEYPYDGSYEPQIATVTKTLRDAIEKIDLTHATIPSYKKSLRIFYDQCMSFRKDEQWISKLVNSITSRIVSFNISDNVLDGPPNATEAWALAGSVILEFGRPVFAYWQPILPLTSGPTIGRSLKEISFTTNFKSACGTVFQNLQLSNNDTGKNWAKLWALCLDLENATTRDLTSNYPLTEYLHVYHATPATYLRLG